jgi:hypothetical protein
MHAKLHRVLGHAKVRPILVLSTMLIILAANACTATPLPPPPPGIEYVPQFRAVWQLLSDRQGISLGGPTTFDLPSHSKTIIHYQSFGDPGGPINTMEMHSDGCIYVAYTPSKGPVWYDSSQANESDDHKFDRISQRGDGGRTFEDLKSRNVDLATWLPASQALPNDRLRAPQWFRICVPPAAPPDTWTEAQRSQIPIGTLNIIFLDSGAYCFWDSFSHIVAHEGGPPEWQTVLPMDTDRNNGQKKLLGDQPLNAISNPYVTWDQLVKLAQVDPARALNILQ